MPELTCFRCCCSNGVESNASATCSTVTVFSLSRSRSLSSCTSSSASTSSSFSMMARASGFSFTSCRLSCKAGCCSNSALCRILLNFVAPNADFKASTRESQKPSGFSQNNLRVTGRTGPSSLDRPNSAKTAASTFRTTPASSLAPSNRHVITSARRHCKNHSTCWQFSSQYLNQLSREMTKSGTGAARFSVPASLRSDGKLYKTNCNSPRAGFSKFSRVIRPVLSESHCSHSSPSNAEPSSSGSTGKVAARASTTSVFSRACPSSASTAQNQARLSSRTSGSCIQRSKGSLHNGHRCGAGVVRCSK
mmetsp:Transcript_46794/g.111301  ORF Transcript_46794/g.111301 Transcript_46794/m.111301 type:complete len:307 (+) Transcript_46794:737-1657(+)